ncbi:neprilysin-like [Prorops nasuta]|uniref:neprilysin-like n=1 Tax=Prorops nasuta TaxID=863751 RepID=UPI0034CF96BB
MPNVPNNKRTQSDLICQTEECIKIGKFILANMNKTVNPCDDFYEYACGNWGNSNPMPSWQNVWNLFTLTSLNAYEQVRGILEARAEADDILPVKLAKKWYKACMNEEASSDKGLSSIVSIVSRIGGWPLAMEDGEWDLIDKTVEKVDKYYTNIIAKSSLFAYTVIPKSLSGECNKSYIEITMPILPLEDIIQSPRKRFYRFTGFYRNTIIRIAKRIAKQTGTVLSQEKLVKDVNDLINFEKELYKIQNIQGTKKEVDSLSIPSERYSSDMDKDINYDSTCNDEDQEESKKDNENFIVANKISKAGVIQKFNQSKCKREKYINMKIQEDKYMKKLNRNSKNHKNSSHNNFFGKMKRLLFRLKQISESRNSNKMNTQQAYSLKRQKRNVADDDRAFERQNKVIDKCLNPISLRSKLPSNKQCKVGQTKINKKYKLNKASEDDDSTENNSILNDSNKKYINGSTGNRREKNDILNIYYSNDDDEYNNSAKDSDENFELYRIDFEKISSKMTEYFKECFDNLFKEIDVNKDDIYVKSNLNKNQLLEYINLLHKTPSEVMANYVHWNFISRMFTLTFDMSDILLQLQKHFDASKLAPRWYRCVQDVKMTQTISYEYVKKYFPKEVSKANAMIDAVKTVTKIEIERSTWMNDHMKKDAEEKVDKMMKHIGYPEWYDNNTAVKNYYKGLKIVSQHFDNALSYKRYTNLRELQILSKEENEGDVWSNMSSFIANGVFFIQRNKIAIPAADFQFPLFSTLYPDALNFGLFGYIIGRKEFHDFDPTGRSYDKNGKKFKWDEQMDKEYITRADCFLKQYSSFSLEAENGTVQVYDNKNLDESISDYTDMHNLYKAFESWRKNKETPDAKIPGLEDYTEDQMFFLSKATTWCENIRPSYVVKQIKTDEHITGRIRVLGGLSNSEEFAKAFSCPVGSKMNPEEKCNIFR